ncbi:PAS domain S-box protein [Azoarcus sp. L1K30]|uniref:PAS domain-containing sensor histidine kinase n=1 Tax=Azoarcus sp. L1K30 TaxID=2820277 RepID=UPI001B82B412|nr:PAS domain S-box protein [Azoarcus sp. L1K30]MBR0565147.1 PAS domain S-box protein [Azoarcus sp. L1K30]
MTTEKVREVDIAARICHLEAENGQLRRELEALRRERPGASRVSVSEQQEFCLRSILDHLPAMVGYWDKEQRNRFSNHAYLTWFGLDPEEVHGKHIREVIGEERYRLNLPYIEGALRGETQQFERMIPKPEGDGVRHSLANYIPDIVDGEVRGFYVLVTETSALHDAKEALRVTEELYRAVIDDQTELISRFSVDGVFTFVNAVFCRFFGKEADELLGRAWTPACHPDDLSHIEAQLATLSQTQPTVVIENRVWSGSGELRWMQFVNRGFFDGNGNLLEVQSVGRDITDRKAAEFALREAHDELERRVIERTEQLRRLAIQTTLAEERERQSIASDLHDGLGQLLHVAKIKLDILTKQLPASACGLAEELDALLADACQVTRSLTTQLSPPVLSKLGLGHALRWLAEEMDRHYGLSVVVDCDVRCPQLTSEQACILFRSARELLINVAKHAGCMEAHLTMACDGGQLVLTVADAGIGMSDVSQVVNETYGFGLASIRERLTCRGGSMDIVSVPGAGSSITLHMPISSRQEASEPR